MTITPRHLYNVKDITKTGGNPYAIIEHTLSVLDQNNKRTYGFTRDRLVNEFANFSMLEDFNWVVYYHKTSPLKATLIPTRWDVFDGTLYSGGGTQTIYRPTLDSSLPMVYMVNYDPEYHRIGMMRIFFCNSSYVSERKRDTGPCFAKITRLNLKDLSHELVDIRFDERWSFDKSEYDLAHHDIFDKNFFKDELSLISAMRHC